MTRRSRAAPFKDLLQELGNGSHLAEAARSALGPLFAYDDEQNGDLEHTLRVYFDCNGNASKAAEALFLHRNGLLYRLSRIESLLDVSLSDSEMRLALEVALWVMRPEPGPASG